MRLGSESVSRQDVRQGSNYKRQLVGTSILQLARPGQSWIDSSRRFRYIKCNHLTTGRKYFHPLCPNNVCVCASPTPSPREWAFAGFHGTPPQSVANAWMRMCSLYRISLAPLCPPYRGIWRPLWACEIGKQRLGAGDNCSLVAAPCPWFGSRFRQRSFGLRCQKGWADLGRWLYWWILQKILNI